VNRAVALYQSSLGKKAVMAVTGIIGYGFLAAHMIGNLQAYPFFGGREALNAYAEFLRSTHGLLWLARGVLVTAVAMHIVAAYQLTRMSQTGRPVPYVKWNPAGGSDYASRTMRWSGPVVGLFLVYHLMHFTLGNAHPDFVSGDVYHNFVAGFQVWYVSLFYVVAMLVLGFHLYHGAWSMFQSLGLNNPKYNPWIRKLAALITFVIVAGNISMPLAVLAGIIS